jgi:hypothetical protein
MVYALGLLYGVKKNMTVRGTYAVATLILVLGFGFQNAWATPVLGQQVYYEGGLVTVTVMPYEASYTNTLYLYSTATPLLIASNFEVGKVVNLGNLSSLGIGIGDELLFGISVADTRDRFFTGPASRNPDHFAHGAVDYSVGQYGDIAELRFEDLWGGGDKDFDDAIFRISGGVGTALQAKVSEPASWLLLIFGFAGVVCMSRFKQNRG